MFDLNKCARNYKLRISTENIKVMAFHKKESILNKIIIRTRVVEELNSSKYLGCEISYRGEMGVGRLEKIAQPVI